MSAFSPRHPDTVFGIALDVGSGSIGVALVASSPDETKATVLWSYRERMIIQPAATPQSLEKAITQALLTTFLEIGNTGIKALVSAHPNASLSRVHVSVSAPWAYTITKEINYANDTPFPLTKRLVADLCKTAEHEAEESTEETELTTTLGLTPIERGVRGIEASGYTLPAVDNQITTNVTLAYSSSFVLTRILEALTEAKDKVLPKASLSIHASMTALYDVLVTYSIPGRDICLVDITYEAIELGIVREGILRHVTHTKAGLYTLARETSLILDVPIDTVLTAMKTNRFQELRSESKGASELKELLDAMTSRLAELFKETGDSLAIPRAIFYHTAREYEAFIGSIITEATKIATKIEHTLHPISTEIVGDIALDDTALAVSVAHFHNTQQKKD